MSPKRLYLYYGISILILGLLGFLLTQAKSALITALAAGSLFVTLSFIVRSNKFFILLAKVFNFALIGAFAWRFSKALILFNNGDASKLLPMILLALLAILSLAVFAKSLAEQSS
jgi:uncharacterized membrane protein (UPF0136 family)